MAVVAGAIVPHAPVLGLEVQPERLRPSSEKLRAAVESLKLDECDVLVMVSPHGRASGVYSGIDGSLDGFGVSGRSVGAPTQSGIVVELAQQWGRPVLEPPTDHGITGAFLLAGQLAGRSPVAASFATTTGPGAPSRVEAAVEGAEALAAALTAISSGRRIGFIASAHTSAALSPAAPLLDKPEGHALEDRVLAALRSDPVGLTGITPELWRGAGACGAGPLTTFGRLFAGRRADLLAYEAPAGVGYLVAQVER